MGNLSLWLWMVILVAVFGFLVPGALAAWMIRRRPIAPVRPVPLRPAVMAAERADERTRGPGVLRDLA